MSPRWRSGRSIEKGVRPLFRSCATIALPEGRPMTTTTYTATPTRKSMVWVIFVAGAVLAWGAYGALLHLGQTQLGNPLKALLCVGVAYFLIGVIVPVIGLSSQGELSGLSGFNTNGLIMATFAG